MDAPKAAGVVAKLADAGGAALICAQISHQILALILDNMKTTWRFAKAAGIIAEMEYKHAGVILASVSCEVAAVILAQMDSQTAASIIAQAEGKDSAKIMAKMAEMSVGRGKRPRMG